MNDAAGRPRARRALTSALVLGAGLTTITVAERPAARVEPVFDGPSVLLSYVDHASPYTGVGRYEGRATCTAFLLDTGALARRAPEAPGYAVTSGHCPAAPGPNDVVVGGLGVGRVVFNLFVDSQRWQVIVPVLRTAYATVKGRDLAVLELAMSAKDLARELIRPLPIAAPVTSLIGEPVDVVGAPLWPNLAEAFLRASRCRIDGIAPMVLEHARHWFDAPFLRCRDMLPGSSGSPVISMVDHAVVGMVSATTSDRAEAACASGEPCEPTAEGVRTRPRTTYLTPLTGLGRCFDERHQFDLQTPGCPLDPGGELAAMPGYLGPVNPLLSTKPMGAAQRAWNVTVVGPADYYRYAVVAPPDDCRTTTGYGAPIPMAAQTDIVVPLPVSEGFAFLCIVGTGKSGDEGGADPYEHPNVVVARTDLTPPRLSAQIQISESDDAWRVKFSTVGQEVAFHLYKAGPPATTRCDDPGGYQVIHDTLIGLPKVTGTHLLCAIPHDAAQNAGPLFKRVFR
ncbi:MAG TPA: serine protease [Vicinamibacterales bacterium]|nr:serine protease [Vicinamibacterales bacterium]